MNRMTIALTILAVALPAMGQGLDSEFPFTGTITGNGAIVRTTPQAAGPNSVMRLGDGTEVTVYGRSEGWLKIKPPQGSFSIIPRYSVKKDDVGQMGTVSEEKPQPVFAGSTLMQPPWPYQMRLPKDTRVQVLGDYVDEGRPFLKITPPEGIYMWVPARNVRKTGSLTSVADTAAGPSDLAGAKDHTKPVDAAATPATPPPAPDPKLEAARAAVAVAEEALKSELAKPTAQQDLDGLLQRYVALKNEHGDRMGGRIEAGMRAITAATKRKQAIMELDNRFRTVNAIQAEPVPQWRTVARTGYAACGTLAASEIYDSADAAYRRFAIHDPSDTSRILAYVQDPTGTIDFSRYIGRNVGIVGTARTQDGSTESVIDAREVVELGAGAIPGLTNPITPGAVKPLPPGGETVAPAPGDQPVDTSRLAPGEIIIDPGTSEPIKPQPVVRPVQPAPQAPVAPLEPTAPTAPAEDRPAPETRPVSSEPPAGFKLFKPDEGSGTTVNPDEYK